MLPTVRDVQDEVPVALYLTAYDVADVDVDQAAWALLVVTLETLSPEGTVQGATVENVSRLENALSPKEQTLFT